MIKLFKRKQQPETHSGKLIDSFIDAQQTVEGLPELSAVERVQFEQDIAISHLYHSSKIEGTTLTSERLEKAINA